MWYILLHSTKKHQTHYQTGHGYANDAASTTKEITSETSSQVTRDLFLRLALALGT